MYEIQFLMSLIVCESPRLRKSHVRREIEQTAIASNRLSVICMKLIIFVICQQTHEQHDHHSTYNTWVVTLLRDNEFCIC